MEKHVFSFRMIALLFFMLAQPGLNLSAQASKKPNPLYIYFNVHLDGATDEDTLAMSIADDVLLALHTEKHDLHYSQLGEMGVFQFRIPVNKNFGFFRLAKQRRDKSPNFEGLVSIIDGTFWEAGDSLTMNVTFKESPLGGNAIIQYTGKGAFKHNLREQLDHLTLPPSSKIEIADLSFQKWDGNVLTDLYFDSISTLAKRKLNYLEQHRTRLSDLAYNIIKANLIYDSKAGKMDWVGGAFVRSGKFSRLDQATKKRFISRFENAFDPGNYDISQEGLANSFEFVKFLHTKLIAASYLHSGDYDLGYICNAISESGNSQETKETLMMLFLWAPRDNEENLQQLYTMAQKFIMNPNYLKILREFDARLPGRIFSDDELTDIKGNLTRISDFKGKVVLVDFWFTGCGKCEQYYRDVLSKAETYYKSDPDVVFISISIDKNEKSWKESISKDNYTSPESVNLYTQGKGSAHALIEKNNIMTYPTTVLINRKGRIVFFNSGNLKKAESLIQAIQNLL